MFSLNRKALSLVLSLSLAVATEGANANPVDDFIRAQMRSAQVPGLSVAVVKDGKIVMLKGYGDANVETRTAATADTVYKIASISKQFIASAIMLLVQDGKMNLDDPVSKFIEGAPASWRDVTVRQVLTHTAGLAPQTDGYVDPPGFEPYKYKPPLEVVKAAFNTPLSFKPGEQWNYSNLGYFVLSEVVSRVSGEPFGKYIADRLFKPAGMAETRLTSTVAIVPNRANGYTVVDGALRNAENWIALRPSGAFLSSVRDMAKWSMALDGNRILSDEIKKQMTTPVKLSNGSTFPYGFGWFVQSWRGHAQIHHAGGLSGFNSDIERFVDDKLSVIVLSNSDRVDITRIAIRVAGFFVPALAPSVSAPIEDKEPAVTAMVRRLVAGMSTGHGDRTLFSASGQHILDDAGWVRGTAAMLSIPGAIRSVKLVKRGLDSSNRQQYGYQVSYDYFTVLLTVSLDKDGKIDAFKIWEG